MTLATHYNSSKGPLLIETMNRVHVDNALNKLCYEDPTYRADEIAALQARKAIADAEFLAYQASLISAGEVSSVVVSS